MIFRNDDISANSDFAAIREMYETIHRYFPEARIVSAFNVLAQRSFDGSPYATLKPKDIDFPAVNRMLDLSRVLELALPSDTASHGLAHIDHRAASRDLQEFSIRASCELLGAKIFVPPFLRWNRDTEKICAEHGIELMGAAFDWLVLDNERMDPSRQEIVFHSWKMSPEVFASRFEHLALP